MKIRKLVSLLLILALVLGSFAACGGGAEPGDGGADGEKPADGEVYKLRLATQWSEASPHSQAYINTFIPRIEELSGGRIKVELYLNNVIGDEAEQASQLQMGQLEMANLSDISGGLDPARMNVYILPFLFKNQEHFMAVAHGEIGKYSVERLPEKGVRVLGQLDFGFRNTTSNFPINSAADLKGRKMRISTNTYQLIPWKEMGANVIALPFPEVYTALETGTVEGQENPISTIVAQRFYEAQKYLAMTNHVRTPIFISVSEKWYQALPQDLKDVLQQAVDELIEDDMERQAAANEEAMKIMEEAGLTITYPDLTGFKAAAKPAYDKLIADYPESEEMIKMIQELGEQY